MKIPSWLPWLVLAVHCIAFIGVKAERDEARQDLSAALGLYNGLLIGRGCEVPE
ncbi:hypothetical protein KSS93_15290 [Pseudomonas xanthosomatis]|uniref:hypothetical protein n=1 Tax=Pseudomonas xanthosomatis TaxID=2842356 RepID=UPI001C3E6EAF|nr:hypothetical protein [Pseudomonas xanthosomatis]QXH44258.1 hypothetical protein KSS93_15290 [Pseudomonas xanthosomatis]